MKKVVKLTLNVLLVLGLATSTFANGLSLNSLGPKALGMGGAFVGLANDATAIYWNPAGLAGQKSALNLYFTGVMPLGTYQYAVPAFGIDIDTKTESKIYPTGGLLGVYSMDKMTFGLGVYVPAGLGATWPGEDLAAFSGGAAFDWESQIGVISISPSFAYQVTDQFSIGVSANIYYAMFDLSRPDAADANQDGTPETPVQYSEESTGLGFGATIGLKYDINSQLSVGATFRTSTAVTMDGTADIVAPSLGNMTLVETDFEREVTWPLWIGGGIAYKPTKCLTLALDAQYSKWSLLDELIAEYDKMPDGEFVLNWDDAVQIRLGGEYLVTPETAIRLGYYYDPAPAPDETLNILFPSSTNHVATIGFGHSFGKYRVDVAAEYLLGGDRDVEAYPNPLQPDNMPGVHHLDVFAFSVGFGMCL
ncbi:MAG: outer membrane protein transport protein [Ignavibacteriae bacterium]|nr:outer membrane protein transport protein [Ignavibacteriota bacterium]